MEKKPLAIRCTAAEGLVANLATTEDEIADLDLESLSAQENNNVIKAIESLRQTINAFLGQVGQEPKTVMARGPKTRQKGK